MRKDLVLVCIFGSLIVTTPEAALSTTGAVTIDFGGLCNQITIAQPPPFYLFPAGGSFTCSSGGTDYFKIEDNGSYRAQVWASSSSGDSDAADDTLRIKDWKITALIPTPTDRPQGYEISVWLQFDNPPITDGPGPNPHVYYRSALAGSITKRTGNWVKMDAGYVTNPLGSAETTLGTPKTYNPTCTGSVCTWPTLTTSGRWPDSPNYLSGPRLLRVKYSFRLNATNDVFLISSTGGKLNSQGSADTELDECSDQYCQCASPSTFITVTTRNGTVYTSSTSGKSDQTQASTVDMFTKASWALLQQDMARGSGEYLASLATLLEVPIEKQNGFFVLAQGQYRALAEAGGVTRMELLSRLQAAIAGGPTLVAGTIDSTP